jgi:hypothetical protein
VDPEPARPELTVSRPFTVTITPAGLTKGLLR